jgi:hypothetical protein
VCARSHKKKRNSDKKEDQGRKKKTIEGMLRETPNARLYTSPSQHTDIPLISISMIDLLFLSLSLHMTSPLKKKYYAVGFSDFYFIFFSHMIFLFEFFSSEKPPGIPREFVLLFNEKRSSFFSIHDGLYFWGDLCEI